MKNKLRLLSMFSAMAMMGSETPQRNYKTIKPKETEEERKKRIEKVKVERNKANGLKQFFYGENSVWANNTNLKYY